MNAPVCLICSRNNWKQWLLPTLTNVPADQLYGAAAGISGTQSLIKCQECGFIIEFPRLSDEVIISGYASAGNAGHDSQYPQRVKSFESTIKRNLKSLPPPPSRVLDIGCAGGAFIEAAGNLGYLAEGVEPAIDLVKSATNRGLKVREGTAETLGALITEKYDIVTLWDVIEHVLDPSKTLDSAIDLLTDDGVLIINIPDIGTPLARLVGKKNWWISSVHIYHFSAKHIEKILEPRGFVVVSKKMFFQSLSLGYLLEIASQMRVPLASFFTNLVPVKLKSRPLPYYASQTTIIAKRATK